MPEQLFGMKRTKSPNSRREDGAAAGERRVSLFSMKTTSTKRPREESTTTATATATAATSNNKKNNNKKKKKTQPQTQRLPFDYRYIVAPMVGASELAFRLMCRKYGAQLCYTPMMMAGEFASSKKYRQREFPTSPLDRPLVCHFAANSPSDFAKAAKLAAPHCDAIDLNLGCPQRTAYVGHFGSYLLDPKERQRVLDIVKAGAEAVAIPICVKIRLLNTFEETQTLVAQLYQAGATIIAVHARYRASFDRKGAGARDGPALLDQVQKLKQAFPNQILITNGNTITYDDVVKNLDTSSTNADGLMSAEGILDNPALFLPRLGTEQDSGNGNGNGNGKTMIPVQGGDADFWQRRQVEGAKWFQKLKKIEKIEKQQRNHPTKALTPQEEQKLSKKSQVIAKLCQIDEALLPPVSSSSSSPSLTTAEISLAQLYETANNSTLMALEYLQWARHYPPTMRTVIFHTRRILKTELATFQLMDDCLNCQTMAQLETLVHKIRGYQADPASFRFDKAKEQAEKDAVERKKQEEGKRKAYEARMMRKAKREGKTDDLDFYLRQGAVVPTAATVQELLTLPKPEQLQLWKDRDHSQHCIGFHLGGGNCPRGRACAFLHVASTTDNTFDESNEVAG
jgi:tRNA-dihydrouridine synthase 1